MDLARFREALTRENHTAKRSLTDPRLFSGIGNAYSDEILHRARMSPAKLTLRMSDEEIARLYEAVQGVLGEWLGRLSGEASRAFPEHVTAFREGMAVHGQTGGKLLADRALSQLLRGDWPKTLEELEERRKAPAPEARSGG